MPSALDREPHGASRAEFDRLGGGSHRLVTTPRAWSPDSYVENVARAVVGRTWTAEGRACPAPGAP